MNSKIILLTLLAMLALSGCSLMQPKGDALSSKLDGLVSDKRYGKALDMLARVPPDSPDYGRFAERRKSIELLATQYARKTVEDARQLVVQDRWQQALALYDEAIDRLPRNTTLRDGLAELHKQQQARILVQEQELAIAKGEWLMTTITIYRRMTTIDPRNSSLQNQLESYQSNGEESATSLLKIANQAQSSGNDEIASRALSLAAKLSEKKEILQAAQRYAQSRAKDGSVQDRRWHELALREQERSEAIQQLINEYTNAIKQKNYIAARTALTRLRSFAPDLVNDKGYEKELNNLFERESDRLYDEGVMYYGRSQFEKARDSWKKTLDLTPTHTKARESLERVEKVLERIEQLRIKQKRN